MPIQPTGSGGRLWWEMQFRPFPHGIAVFPAPTKADADLYAQRLNATPAGGPFPTEAAAMKDALRAANGQHWLVTTEPGPDNPGGSASGTVSPNQKFQGGIGNISLPSFHSGILDFLSKLNDSHTWLRVAEVTVGVVLLAVALNAFLKQTTGVSPVQVVGKVTDKVPKVVPI